MYPYKIQIKDLKELVKYKPIHSEEKYNFDIIKFLIDNGLIYNSTEHCNETLQEILFWNDLTVLQFCVKFFGIYTERLEQIVKNLEIWGASNECPECGCEFEYYGDIKKCSNCDFWDKVDIYEPSSDQYRDDCKFDFTNRLN